MSPSFVLFLSSTLSVLILFSEAINLQDQFYSNDLNRNVYKFDRHIRSHVKRSEPNQNCQNNTQSTVVVISDKFISEGGGSTPITPIIRTSSKPPSIIPSGSFPYQPTTSSPDGPGPIATTNYPDNIKPGEPYGPPDTSCDSKPPGQTKMVCQKAINVFMNKHNGYRSDVALGKVPNGKSGKNLPSASNMYFLSWDPHMADVAQKVSDQCKFEHSGQEYGESLYMISPIAVDQDAVANSSVSLWWNEIFEKGLDDQEKLTFGPKNLARGVGHFSQIIWYATYGVGCGITHCPDQKMTLCVCEYYPAGNYEGQQIYQEGPPCKEDKDCLLSYGKATCDPKKGLCYSQQY